MHLTKRQRELYQYLKDHIHGKGYAPSIMEIGRQFGLSSPATVHKHLTHLENKGLIRKEHNLSRAIEIVEEPASVLSREYVLLSRAANPHSRITPIMRAPSRRAMASASSRNFRACLRSPR